MNKQQQKNKCILVNLRIILNASDIDEKKKATCDSSWVTL